MTKKIKWMAALAGVSALTFYAGAHISVQASANNTAQLWDGFAITATAVRTADPVGLRFKTDVERLTPTMKKYNPDAEYYTTLTFTAGGKTYSKDIPATVWRADGSGWNTVLLSIPESDYATEITAQSFIKLNGKETEFFQTEPVTVSITQTAAAAISYGATQNYITQYVDEQVSSLTLDKTSATMEEGQTLNLTATTAPVQCMAKWTSSDRAVATVDNFGNVKAKGVGESIITAEINGYTATCKITVINRTETISGFASELKPGMFDKTQDITTWLNNVFADERVEAFTFDVSSNKNNSAFKTSPSMISVALSANKTVHLTFNRSMYEKWKVSGTTTFKITTQYDKR